MSMENEKETVFEKAFGDVLKEENEEKIVVHQPEESLEDVLSEDMDIPLSEEVMASMNENYVPPSVGDEDWEEFVSREPLPPISRLDESRAVSLGLQEMRKQKEYMLHTIRHVSNEFTRVYATYPLLLSKDIEEIFTEAQKKSVEVIQDMEHLIAGDFDRMEAAKQDFKLHQVFEEKRLSVLYDILEYYNNRK